MCRDPLIRFFGGSERAGFEGYRVALVFLEFFADFPDQRQRGKVIYPLEEVLLLCLPAGGGCESGDLRRYRAARSRSNFFAASCRSGTGRRSTTTSATFLQRSCRRRDHQSSSPAWLRSCRNRSTAGADRKRQSMTVLAAGHWLLTFIFSAMSFPMLPSGFSFCGHRSGSTPHDPVTHPG